MLVINCTWLTDHQQVWPPLPGQILCSWWHISLQSDFRTDHKTPRTISFGPVRPKWRCLPTTLHLGKTKRNISTQTPQLSSAVVGGWWIGLEVQPQDLGTLQSSSWINLCLTKYSRVTCEDLWEPKLGWNSHSRRQWFKRVKVEIYAQRAVQKQMFCKPQFLKNVSETIV